MRIFLNRVVFNDVLLKITLLISTIFYCIPPLMPIVDTFINLLLVWTLIFLLHEFLTRDTYFNSNYYIFAFLAALFYGITFLVRGTHIIDLKILFYIIMDLFLFVGNRSSKNGAGVEADIVLIARILVITSFLISVGSLITYALNISVLYRNTVYSGNLFLGIGDTGALYGLIGNSNRHCWLCILSMGFSFYLLLQAKKLLPSAFLTINLLVQSAVIALSQSRGGFISLLVFSIIVIANTLIVGHKNDTIPTKKKMAIVLLSCVLCVTPIFMELFPQEIVDISQSTVIRTDEEKGRNVNARFQMYQTGLQIVQEHPLLGVGGNDLKSLAKSYMSDDYSMKNSLFSDNFHDIFIQTAVQGGLIQLVVLLCAMAIPILHSISALLKRKLPLGFGYLLSIALSLLAINLVESELYMARNFSAFSFWLVLGWGLALCPPLEESKLLGLQKKLMPWTRKKS